MENIIMGGIALCLFIYLFVAMIRPPAMTQGRSCLSWRAVGEWECSEGTAPDCELQEGVVHESARSWRGALLASYFTPRFAPGQAP